MTKSFFMSCVLKQNECFKMLNNERWYRCLIHQLVSAKMVGKKKLNKFWMSCWNNKNDITYMLY
jgi:hypothetical protein